MLILSLLIVLAASQSCPYCQYNACSISIGGVANCSQCTSIAALVPLQIPQSDLNGPTPVGVCMLCPENCGSCEYAVMTPSMSLPILSINCTSCAPGYVNNYAFGNCTPCPTNCITCQCGQDGCDITSCVTCATGYAFSGNICVATTTTAQGQLQDESSNNSSAIIGLSIWGAVVTIIAGIFIGLWLKGRQNDSSAKLLGSYGESRQVAF